jgi:hypothetical protein
MDARVHQELMFRLERLLVGLGPTLARYSISAWREAAALVASACTGALHEPGDIADALYSDAIQSRHVPGSELQLPAHARGQFPYTKPTAHLRDQQAAIEAMLAPVSDRRARAHFHRTPQAAQDETRTE